VVVLNASGGPGPGDAVATLSRSLVVQNARAGLLNIGARVALEATGLGCNSFDLNGEVFFEAPFTFDNLGGNGCGCPAPAGSCVARSSGLVAPDVLADVR
jgi:hypothetical protein